jgi:hypothetical protein
LLDREVPESNVLRYSLGAEAAALGATFFLASEAGIGRRQQNQRSDGWTDHGCLPQQNEIGVSHRRREDNDRARRRCEWGRPPSDWRDSEPIGSVAAPRSIGSTVGNLIFEKQADYRVWAILFMIGSCRSIGK